VIELHRVVAGLQPTPVRRLLLLQMVASRIFSAQMGNSGQSWETESAIMNQSTSPRNWICPSWHPDWGNTKFEFEHLRHFALLLLAAEPNLTVDLKTPEPGLMYVNIRMPDSRVAEVYSVPCVGFPEKRQLAIFFAIGTPDDEEIYAETVQSAVNCFSERLTT
jgi:hypothetical protein